MTLKVKPTSVRRKVNVLKQPTPTFVSFVDHAATQTPFAVVKRGPKSTNQQQKDDAAMTVKRSNKQKSSPVAKAKAKKSSASEATQTAVYKLSFQQDTFPTEASVKKWLAKNQWDGNYEVKDEGGEFIVKSKTAKSEDHFDLREVPLTDDGSVSALVSKVALGGSELTAKAGKKTTDLGNATQDEGTGDDDDDGTDAAGTKAENAAGGTDDDDDNDDGASDDEDEDADPEDDPEDDEDDIETRDLTAADDEDIDGNSLEDDDGENAEGDYNHDNDPADDDAEGAEDAAGVDDPEGYGDRRPGKGNSEIEGHTGADGKEGHRSIRDKEKKEPLPKDLPGQAITPTGAGKPGHEPGIPGKNRIVRRMKAGRMPIGCVDRLIRKFDGYSVYLSGGTTLKDVLSDGLDDGIPPGVSEVFQSLYKAVGNTLKVGKNTEINSEITAISGEFSEAVLALHSVWKGLLKTGTKEQKTHAKKWMADIAVYGDLQTFANTALASAKKQATVPQKSAKRAPVRHVETSASPADIADIVAKAVAKATQPLTAKLDQAEKRLKQLSHGAPVRKGLGSDDLEVKHDAEAIRKKQEEDEDEEFIRQQSRKTLFGTTRG